jgi:hypothetical protein
MSLLVYFDTNVFDNATLSAFVGFGRIYLCVAVTRTAHDLAFEAGPTLVALLFEGIFRQFAQPHHSEIFDGNATEQKGKFLVVCDENVGSRCGADCVLQIAKSGAFRGLSLHRSSVDE